MQTNFFEHINTLQFQGALNLNLIKNADGLLTISVYLPNATADTAGHLIPPMILKGQPAELDAGFFGAIAAPVQQTASLFANREAYRQSLKKAAELSKSEQDKKNKQKGKATAATTAATDDDDDEQETENLFSAQENEQKAIAEKKKRYTDAMEQISELNKQCKYAEAIALLPSVEEYPDHADEINRKSAELQKRKAQYEDLMKDI